MTERRYRFFTCDVFTRERFGGNPLAVLPDARGLDAGEMQRIAREFNYSESTFVLPPEAGGDRRVRIFTPQMEVPFAGHPNIGTAFVLHRAGELESGREARFEEEAGVVPDVLVYCRSDGEFDLRARMFAPFDGVAEDPATGSANGALAALLTERDPDLADGADLSIEQGVEMGRPSVLRVQTEKKEGRLVVTIGGYSVLVTEGMLTLD